MKVARWSIEPHPQGGGYSNVSDPKNGKWVRYEDYAQDMYQLESTLQKEIQQMRVAMRTAMEVLK